MVSRRIIIALLYALAVLVAVFVVLMAFYGLIKLLNDQPGAQALLWIGMACLMLILSDLILLVGCLGINSVAQGSDSSDDL